MMNFHLVVKQSKNLVVPEAGFMGTIPRKYFDFGAQFCKLHAFIDKSIHINKAQFLAVCLSICVWVFVCD